jgi:hypothetical protein
VRSLRAISSKALDALFGRATVAAAKEALQQGLTVTGTNGNGKVVSVTRPIEAGQEETVQGRERHVA